VFLVTMNVTVVTVTLPDVQPSLHARPDELERVIDAYNLVGASPLLSAGFLADRIGRKRALRTGHSGFSPAPPLSAPTPAARSRSAVARGLDLRGQVLAAALLACITYALIEAPRFGWASARIVALLAAGAGLIAVFVAVEVRVPHPLLDLRVFRDRQFSGAIVITVAAFFAFSG